MIVYHSHNIRSYLRPTTISWNAWNNSNNDLSVVSLAGRDLPTLTQVVLIKKR